MKKLDKRIKVGTKVKLFSKDNNWKVVDSVNYTRVNFQIVGEVGAYQRAHIVQFSNGVKSWQT